MEELSCLLREASEYRLFGIRGIYSSADTRRAIDSLVEKAASSGFNLLIWFVNPRRGPEGVTAFYRTEFFPCGPACEEDLLAYLIERGHEAGLKVWAWFGFMGYKSLLEKHRDCAAVWPSGESTLERPCSPRGERFYVMNPAHPSVVEFWKHALLDLVARYKVDGVNFEDDFGYGYCGELFSYDELNRRRFTRFLEEQGIADLNWPSDAVEEGRYYSYWVEYKCQVVARVARHLVKAVKSARPGLEVSLATEVSRERNRRVHGIDWVELGREGVFDYFTFMAYTADDHMLGRWVKGVFGELQGSKTKPVIITGWELRGHPAVDWVRQALIVRELGGDDLIMFWDGGLDSSNAWGCIKALFEAMRR